ESRGVGEQEAERRAWATVNKESGGGNKSGSGRGKPDKHVSSHKGGKLGGEASASRSKADRSASAKKAAATRKRNAEHRASAHG
ncbi:MAG: plasmid stabilization protein, partial [Geminicoccaceae bacterium]